ncbi:MAG: Asp-tRNA(Asn)/Glu-tRNA(Gln) amidotransferase subunit GatA [Melioribacteraceae bacterium]|nr:Asp-tRNA(Asn)/Glu-tRNA(Gln) amidotransferase subunit GatA [Melioribacteraceae bacterium]
MITYKNFYEKLDLLKNGSISLKENVEYFLNEIESNKELNAFNSVFKDAIISAEKIEQKIKNGSAGKLAGMVIAIKDVLAIENKPLTCSSKILENFQSLYTGTAVQKLIDEDAILIGKTNCDEFAMGSSNENSYFGPVKNPRKAEYVPGGSSGGSAVAVAAGLCDVALGTDTGGSIRQPASFCGIYGLKPSYGRVSRYGLNAFASSFDSIGAFANNIDDIALVQEVISGFDSLDSTSENISVPSYTKFLSNKEKIKIGVPAEYFGEGLNPEIKNAITEKIDNIKANGAEIIEISLPKTEYAIATYYILTTAEASSNLARFDGARYGYRTPDKVNLMQMYTKSRSEGFGKEVKRRIMLGTYVLSAGYYDAYYKKAQQVRRLISDDFKNAFSKVDLILSPTTPTTAFKIGEKTEDPLAMYLGDIYTTSANLAGIPGINIPIGNDSNGLPIGMQLMADQFNEDLLLSFVKKFLDEQSIASF